MITAVVLGIGMSIFGARMASKELEGVYEIKRFQMGFEKMEETLRVREDKMVLKYFRIVKEGNVDVYFRKGKRYTGIVEMTTKDDIVTGTGKIIEGYKEGEWKFFYPNGKYLGLNVFFEGEKNGKIEKYYENGQLEFEGHYKNDRKIGEWKWFDESGNIINTQTYDGTQIEKSDSVVVKKSGSGFLNILEIILRIIKVFR